MKSIAVGSINREPIEWLWQERIPRGMISLVAGMPGVGKSLFGYFLAGHVSRNGGFVLFSTREESLRKTGRARIEAAATNMDRLRFLKPSPDLPGDLYRLREEIAEWKASLVVLDPVASHLSTSIFNDQEVRRALDPLSEIAEETNCAIVLISHTVKAVSRNAHPLDAIGGSGGGLRGNARVVYILGTSHENAEGAVLLSQVKSNVGPELPSFVFEIDEHDFLDGTDVAPFLVEAGEGDDSVKDARLMLKEAGHRESSEAKREAAAQFLVDFLRAGPLPAAQVKAAAEKNGHAWRTVRRAADELGIERPAGGPGSTWSLPDGLLDSLDDPEVAFDGG